MELIMITKLGGATRKWPRHQFAAYTHTVIDTVFGGAARTECTRENYIRMKNIAKSGEEIEILALKTRRD
jgi:hypothetical protein